MSEMELAMHKEIINKLEQQTMNQIVLQNNFNEDKISLIKNTVAKDATDLELQLFIEQCKRTGLDPITRQIYFIKDHKGKVQIQTSIDGFRLVAERSGEYEGQTPPQWCGTDGVWKDVWLSKTPPSACKVGVWKKNFREPLFAVALFEEYAQKKHDGSLSFMWGKMPALMIAKVSESLALRKAFPNDLSGLYTQEEMAQSDNSASSAPPERNSSVWAEKKTITQRSAAVLHSDQFESVGIGINASQDSGDTRTATTDFTTDQRPDGTSGHYPVDSFRIGFGKFKDKKLIELNPQDLLGYYNYLNKQLADSGKPASPKVEEFLSTVENYLNLK